jgi:choline dehydrogenase-like flavoprotein
LETEFDLVVIGAGSGGVAASRRAAAHGARVAIVEARRVGGTCVLRGCVPKKLLMYAAEFGEAFATARGYGWAMEPPHFEMPHWAAAKAAETTRLEGIYRRLLEGSGVALFEGAEAGSEFGHAKIPVRCVDGRSGAAGGGTRSVSRARVPSLLPPRRACYSPFRQGPGFLCPCRRSCLAPAKAGRRRAPTP